MDAVLYLQSVRGTFGNCDKDGNYVERIWPTTFGMNEKGGMDNEEFAKYVTNSILPLYPDVEDKKGKRVLIKIDSGLGRLNLELLAQLRTPGFILYPGVPNTTAVTQETDQNYGLFKSKFRMNLQMLTDARIAANESVSIVPWLVGLLVFGGEDPVTKSTGFFNCFSISFSKEKSSKLGPRLAQLR